MHAGFTIESLGGACPTQATGRLNDGRPFYFRARHGDWELEVGPVDADLDGEWLGASDPIASGPDPSLGYMRDEDVLAILNEHLGHAPSA